MALFFLIPERRAVFKDRHPPPSTYCSARWELFYVLKQELTKYVREFNLTGRNGRKENIVHVGHHSDQNSLHQEHGYSDYEVGIKMHVYWGKIYSIK